MLQNLFGESLLVNLLLAFAIVFILIVATFWLLRRFGGARIGGASRGRQPRLAVIDAAAVDGRRRLVLIRRDNVEHLVMIGGPSDVVIEQNIVRAVPVAPARDAAARPPGAPEPRVEAPAAEPAPRPPRPLAAPDDGWPTGEPPLRPQRPEPAWGGPAEPPLRPYRPPPPAEDVRTPAPEPRAPRLEPSLRAPTPRVDTAARVEPRPEPAVRAEPPARGDRREPSLRAPAVAPEVAPPEPAPAAGEKPTSEPTTVARTPPLAPDANLADMAQRLEAALRRPIRPSAERAAEPGAKPAPSIEPP
ncbi:MAG TPA: flagellar biosynthetic protein FliO, partial [Xanthobacteraceae bacterium]|nr:flagellar biosynthetic protein FliO [Xanthobacteraceae bacterium]